MNKIVDGINGHTEASGKCRGVLRFVESTDFLHALWSECGIFNASCSFFASSFAVHIPHVVPLRSKEQVTRSNTRGGITLVQNLKPFRNWAIVQCPRESMGAVESRPQKPWTVGTIPIPNKWACPDPTFIGLSDLLPKPDFWMLARLFSYPSVMVDKFSGSTPRVGPSPCFTATTRAQNFSFH